MEATEGWQPHGYARAAFERHDYRAVEHILGTLPQAELLGDPELGMLLASAKARLFEHGEAKTILEAIEPSVAAAHDEWLLRRWQNGYAVHLIYEGSLDSARRLLDQCVSSAEASAEQRFVGYVNNTIGILAAHLGEVETALTHFTRSIVAWRRIGDARRVGFGHYNAAVVLREWDRPTEAAAQLLLSLQYIGVNETLEESVVTSAERSLLLMALGDSAQSERIAREAHLSAASLESRFLNAVSGRALGAVLLANGSLDEAANYLHDAYHAIAATRNVMLRAEIAEELACLALRRGSIAEAREYETEAVALFARMNSAKHAERCTRRILTAATARPNVHE